MRSGDIYRIITNKAIHTIIIDFDNRDELIKWCNDTFGKTLICKGEDEGEYLIVNENAKWEWWGDLIFFFDRKAFTLFKLTHSDLIKKG